MWELYTEIHEWAASHNQENEQVIQTFDSICFKIFPSFPKLEQPFDHLHPKYPIRYRAIRSFIHDALCGTDAQKEIGKTTADIFLKEFY